MDKLWAEWLTLYRLFVQVQPLISREVSVSAPFFSADSGGHDAEHRLLYVGQSTSHGWYDDEFAKEHSVDSTIQSVARERMRRNRDAVAGEYWGGGFWLTFRTMSDLLGNQPVDHSNALWSNVAKIGVSQGNPDGLVYSMQAELAARTLRAEISEYRPTIVAFVTGRYGSSIVLAATGTSERDWHKSESDPRIKPIDSNVWWIPRDERSGQPALLWTDHPSRGITREKREFWALAARHLSEGNANLASCIPADGSAELSSRDFTK